MMSNPVGPEGLQGCFRCAFVWRPRHSEPRLCPRCKSRSWDVPRLEKVRRGGGLGISEIIGPKRIQVTKVLRNRGVLSARVFGSVARGQARRHSDLDLLVTFEPRVSGFDQLDLSDELVKQAVDYMVGLAQ